MKKARYDKSGGLLKRISIQEDVDKKLDRSSQIYFFESIKLSLEEEVEKKKQWKKDNFGRNMKKKKTFFTQPPAAWSLADCCKLFLHYLCTGYKSSLFHLH